VTEHSAQTLALFSQTWWHYVLEAWNRSADREKMAGLGTVHFILYDVNASAACICWDDLGRASHATEAPESAPIFAATAENWLAFLEGEIQFPGALFQGQLEYEGSLTRIIPYSAALNLFASVAHKTLDEIESTTDS
jgi:hypothetical protein